MPLEGEYGPSPAQWVREQVELYESSARGARGAIRSGGLKRRFPHHPVWYFNLKADPRVDLQDGPQHQPMVARELTGDEKALWWQRAVAAYPAYAEYQEKTSRVIPVFVLEPESSTGTGTVN